MVGNSSLHLAKAEKNDEFYTQLTDIENELKHYKEHFKGKTVYCNCDDPFESNFFKYFAMNFNFLGLKKLIATSYVTSPIAHTQLNLFGDKRSYKIEINEVFDANGDGAEDISDVKYLLETGRGKNKIAPLMGDGDFRSIECIDLLKKSDIVVTNPPFSIAREFFIPQLFEYNKKFLIIGDLNWIKYKTIFPLLKENKMWIGYNYVKSFTQPDGCVKKFGNKLRFTNLNVKKRDEKIILFKKYTNDEYPQYDNYDAINVDKVSDIPMDYNGIMGVPITFIDKYNPNQFEIIDLLNRYTVLDSNGRNEEIRKAHSHMCNINGVATFSRILIRKK